MDAQVSWLLAVTVKPGETENFRALMGEMVTSTKAEPGALSYEWFSSEDETTVHLYERYADSDAMLTHLDGFGENFAERFLAIVEPTGFDVYGEPSDAVREALVPFGPAHYGTFGGFVR